MSGAARTKSLRELAMELGVSASYLSQVAHGKRPPSVGVAGALAQITGSRTVKQHIKQNPSTRRLGRSRPGVKQVVKQTSRSAIAESQKIAKTGWGPKRTIQRTFSLAFSLVT